MVPTRPPEAWDNPSPLPKGNKEADEPLSLSRFVFPLSFLSLSPCLPPQAEHDIQGLHTQTADGCNADMCTDNGMQGLHTQG
jgi:hypothetical protein